MPALEHSHTYVRYKKRSGRLLRQWVWRCDDPRCTHIAEYEMVLDKVTCCTKCGAEFLFSREAMRRVRPMCNLCSKTKRGEQARRAATLMQRVTEPMVSLSPSQTSQERDL